MILSNMIKSIKVLSTEGPLDIEIGAIYYDSRHVAPRSLFFCIEGYKSDGHDFAKTDRKSVV